MSNRAPAQIDVRLHARQGDAFLTEATEVLYGGAVGGGKALALETPLATPFGWTTMGEVQAGDYLFDEKGQPTRVVAVTPIMQGRPCYSVGFSDGSKIVADADHEWLTLDHVELAATTRLDPEWRAARRAKRPRRVGGKKSEAFTLAIAARNSARGYDLKAKPNGSIRTTRELAETVTYGGGKINHAVPVAAAIQCDAANLSVDPYVLGAWLGDGNSNTAGFTSADEEIVDAIAACGHEVRKHVAKYRYGIVGGLQVELRKLGVLNNKHIPVAYLRASESQRLALLQGLMDTDGHANAQGHCEFSVTRKRLADDMFELLSSLGVKAVVRVGRAVLNGRLIGPKYTIKFVTDKPAFRLARKLIRQKRCGFRGTHARRYITSVEPVDSVSVRCVQVDSPNHMYLAGHAMIPTHNSLLMRIAAMSWCSVVPGLQVYLFRRLRDDLIKNHVEGSGGFRALLQPWVLSGHCDIVEDEIRFWNGSKIYLCHCKDEKDRFKYLGAEIHVLLVDELSTFTDVIYRFLRSRVRMAGISVPSGMEGRFPRILTSSNPGNIGHQWVKAAFIDPREPMKLERMPAVEGGMLRQYIPAKLSDNPSVNPTEYADKVRGLGNPALVKAMLEGDWSVVAGAFFPEFDMEKHVIKPRSLPAYWQRFRSFDWGSARPFAVHWWAVSDGELYDFPRGALICYREWYGAEKDEAGATVPNKGLRLTVEEVADGIVERERGDAYGNRVMSGVADPAIFASNGGPSMADRMIARKCFFRPADNTRVARDGAAGGWDHVRSRLKGEDGTPMIYFFDTCRDVIRTLPSMQHDEGRPEDIDTEGEDHAADSVRYGCASRPYTAPLPSAAHEGERDGYARKWKPGRRQRGSAMAA